MKKEIGSIYPLSDKAISKAEAQKELPQSGGKVYYSLCREALFDIASFYQISNNSVLIPAYTCQTVITPFKEAGWNCFYYSIQNSLRIDIPHLFEAVSKHNPSLIVVHPYYGMELNDEEESALKELNGKGIKIVLDLTQCIFSAKRYSFVDFTVASYRKWFPIPDGGFLENNNGFTTISQPKIENTGFTDREIAAMYLRGQYFGNGEQRTKTISIRLSKAADYLAEHAISPHRISSVAFNLLQQENVENNQRSRYTNYAYLFKNIRESDKISKVCQNLADVTTAPLYFTIYVQNRLALQRLLAEDSIYAPVLWPVEEEDVLIDEEVKYIYEHILAIPCDQRYDANDMQRVVSVINNF